MRTLVWFRGKDLRLSDHGPLVDACDTGEVIPLFVLDPFFFAPRKAKRLPHRMQFLLESLTALEKNIEAKGSRLLIASGASIDIVPDLARRFRVDRVVAQRWVEPFARKRDRIVEERLDVPFELFEGETLLPPGTLRNGSGAPYSVYTPFAKAFRARVEVSPPLRVPRLPALPSDVEFDSAPIPSLADLGIEENPRVISGGERAARARLKKFLAGPVDTYQNDRDRMDRDGTSRLSADLKFGTLSVRSVWSEASTLGPSEGRDKFLAELLWREFAHSTLWDRPELLEVPFRRDFLGFPWRDDDAAWRAWTDGTTGYPIVDAACRQLLVEGYVHNRARMISASFLTKHLLIDFRRGEAHYMKYLVDGDWAQNDMGWQWSAGCGVDAQPYFRVFNPITQGEKFDPEGEYVRRYVPELKRLPTKYLFAPWTAPAAVLESAGVRLGQTYPAPIVDHAIARKRFLDTAARALRSPEILPADSE